MADVSDAIKRANPTLFSLPTEADKARNVQYNLDPGYVVQTDYGKVPGKQVVGVGVYKHPVLGYTYEYDIYSDGTNSLSEFFKSIGGEEKIKEYVPTVGYRDLNRPGFRLLSISRLLDGGGGGGGGSSLTTGSGSSAPSAAYTATDGTKFTDQGAFANYQKMLNESAATKEKDLTQRRSAFQILKEEFDRYGIGKLVGDVERLLVEGTPPAEYAFQLRQTPTYKQRFAANEERLKKGLRVLDEASYVALEDQYQDVMRRYGLPETYYQRDEIGTQKAFQKLIAADVSNIELEKRIQNTQARIFDANPEVMTAMRQFYPGITNGEILAYALDPETALPQLERKIAAAEIGGAALQAGLGTSAARAEELAAAGITKAAAQEQYGKIAQMLPRAGTLAEIYKQGPYTQAIAETEAFGLKGAAEATKQRKLLTELEQAQFAGQSGAAKSALARERAGQF